jgi:type I restriction enzyme, R subunit
MTTDTSEKGLESLIVAGMTGRPAVAPLAVGTAGDASQVVGPAGWIQGEPETYDREYAVDLAQLSAFIHATQPEVVEALERMSRF